MTDAWHWKRCLATLLISTRLETGVWHWLKDVALANVCAANLAELKKGLRVAINQLRHKPAVIKASFAEAKLA